MKRNTKPTPKPPESRTDWARVIADENAGRPVVLNDDDALPTLQELAAGVRRYRGQRGPQKTPTKQLVTIRLSSAVVDHFKAKAGGKGWQTQMDRDLLTMIDKRSAGRQGRKRVVNVAGPARRKAKGA